MAILGLTDQTAKLPIIGVLRKGDIKTSKNKPGKDLEYFRFTSDDTEAVSDFFDSYGLKPTRINVFLPHDHALENMDSWKEDWVAGGLVHRCDGEFTVLNRTQEGRYSTRPVACPGNCKPVGRLSVIVQELGRLATVTSLTTSIHDIINLTSQLKTYENLLGSLRGVPFVLTRSEKEISTPEMVKKGNDYVRTGKRLRRKKWLLSIETSPQYTKLKLSSMQHDALPEFVDVIETDDYSTPQIVSLPPEVQSPFDESEPEKAKNTNGNYTPQRFMDDVNERLREESLPEYKELSHLAQVIGDGTWPVPENREAWIKAGKAAIQHKAEEPFLLSIIENINGFDNKKAVKAAIVELGMEIVLGDENAIESLTATLSDYATEKFFTEDK